MTFSLGFLAYGLDRQLSGISRYTVELVHALRHASPRPRLTLLTAGEPKTLARANGYRRLPLRGCSRLPTLLTLGSVFMPRLSRRNHLDVVHDPTGVTPFGLGAGGARTVVTVHDVFAWAFPGTSTRLDSLIYRYWLPRMLPGVDAVITVSASSKADITRYLKVPTERVHSIALAPGPAFQPYSQEQIQTVRARHGLPKGYLLFLGAQDKRRNLPRLLQAYARLRQWGEARPLVVVGARRSSGPALATQLRRLHLEAHVRVLGHVPEADLPALYAGASLFVFPSLYEGFGLPPLEAMACGAPVACSNAASLPELVGDAAVMFDPYDVGAMARAMHRVLADGELSQELRERGLRRAADFTWERTARETLRVYERVLNSA